MTGIWPGSTTCVALLTFDLDGESSLLRRYPEAEKHPSLFSTAQFGPKVGVFRILDLLDRYGIRSTFFIPGWVAERNQETVRLIQRRGHEVAHHGYLHEAPSSVEPQEEAAILDRGIRILEGITGQRPLGYRSPSWELSEHSLELLAERGFLYESSLMGDDVPYLVPTSRGPLVELPVQWALDDAPYYVHQPLLDRLGPMASPHQVYNAWQWEFDGAYQYGRLFMLTMHPQVTGRLAKVMVLERLVQYIRSHANVEFLRCIDVAQRWTEKGMRRGRRAVSRKGV